MSTSETTRKRLGRLAALAATGTIVFGACGGPLGELRAERQGKQVGDAVCDVKSSDSADEAENELQKVQRQAKDLERIVGRPLDEDVSDIEENLNDLVKHVTDGNDALREQDIAAIQRNVDEISRTLSGKAKAAYDGVQEGLANCDY